MRISCQTVASDEVVDAIDGIRELLDAEWAKHKDMDIKNEDGDELF